eukprot:TRINITY_DN4739_c0_g1_i1.p1 TRINITY_DN4739_c0_g1~~TRINITY_DN4739_c0_g1_i1.p1  ORF type:complete len:187 (+),score=80.61 TRINITY_DN4739_c0_g1_i1:25-561(+)
MSRRHLDEDRYDSLDSRFESLPTTDNEGQQINALIQENKKHNRLFRTLLMVSSLIFSLMQASVTYYFADQFWLSTTQNSILVSLSFFSNILTSVFISRRQRGSMLIPLYLSIILTLVSAALCLYWDVDLWLSAWFVLLNVVFWIVSVYMDRGMFANEEELNDYLLSLQGGDEDEEEAN